MLALLSYVDVTAVEYRNGDIGVRLTKEQQSFIVQAVALFNSLSLWSDAETYFDEIDALVADSQNALLVDEVYPPAMLNIDLYCANGAPLAGAGTLTYSASATLPFGYAMSNASTTLFGIENDVWLRAGDYSYTGWSSLTTNGGNTDVAITDGASVIDVIASGINQSGTFGTRVKTTGTFTIPEDGFYKCVAANNGTGVGAGRQANWVSHHIRQTA